MTGKIDEEMGEEMGESYCSGCGWRPEYPFAHMDNAFRCSKLQEIYEIEQMEDGDIVLTHKQTGERHRIII